MAQWIYEGSTNSVEWKCRMVVDLISQNINNNTSTVKVTFQWTRARSSSYASNGSTSYGITIDGATNWGTCAAYNYSSIGVNDWKTIGSMTLNTGHTNDGSKSVTIACQWSQSGVNPTSSNVSATFSLPTIPRSSSVTCTDGNIGSAVTVNISRASSSFTHTLTYNFSGLTGTIATKTTSTSIGWTIPTSFYAKIPNAKNGKVTITCDTYSGTTLIGTTTCTATCSVTNSNPSVSVTVSDSNASAIALTGSNQKLVKGISNANISTSATGLNSATISSISVACGDGKSATGSNVTLNGVISANFTIVVTDSRGFATTVTKALTLIDYIKPAITQVSIGRLETTSPLTKITVSGNYWNGNFGSQDNARILSYYWKESGTQTWSSQIQLTPTVLNGDTFSYEANLEQGFDIDKGYDILVRIQDKITQFDKTEKLVKSNPLIVAYKDKIKINGDILDKEGFKVINEYSVPMNSQRDNPNGFLVRTYLPANNGLAWYLKIEGNTYGGSSVPLYILAQGYLYNNSGLNYCGVSISGAANITTIDVFGYNGYLHFWFPQSSYWQGYMFSCYQVNVPNGYRSLNRVAEITNSARPTTSSCTFNHTITLKRSALV